MYLFVDLSFCLSGFVNWRLANENMRLDLIFSREPFEVHTIQYRIAALVALRTVTGKQAR